MKRSLMRPTAALFPAVLLAATLLGNGANCNLLFFAYLIMQLLTLCGVEAFRNAAAREPGVRRVDKRFSGTFLQMALGLALEMVVCSFLFKEYTFITHVLPVCLSAWFILIEQLFEERMFALSHPSDGVVLSIVANVLLLAGLVLDGSGGVSAPVEGFYAMCGAGLGMAISIAASYIIEPMHAFSLKPVNIGFFPKAAVQSLLYPAVVFVLSTVLIYLEPEEGSLNDLFVMEEQYLFAGWILWRLSRTVCRRTGDESRKLNLMLVAACAALIIGGQFMGEWLAYGVCVLMALFCALIVYCAPSIRLYAAFVLLSCAWTFSSPYSSNPLVIVVLCIIAVILNTHKAFLKKV